MSKKFKFISGWKVWNTGDVIDQYQYNRLPIEIKGKCVVEIVPEIIPDLPVIPKENTTNVVNKTWFNKGYSLNQDDEIKSQDNLESE